jgi:anti-sigma factor RsiW
MKANEHPDALLPWYVNRTLDDAERDQVERHLQTCTRCRTEAAFLEGLRAQVQHQDVLPPTELGLKRLLRDVRAERRAAAAPWWQRAAAAAIVVVVIQAGLLASLWRQAPDGIRPLGDTANKVAVLQVRFAADATEARMRAALQDVGAMFIDGPSANGLYRLHLTGVRSEEEAEIGRDIARLRESGVVEHVARE